MAFIYILYTSVIILILIVLYLSFDYYQMRNKLMEIPIKLQSELDEKMKMKIVAFNQRYSHLNLTLDGIKAQISNE